MGARASRPASTSPTRDSSVVNRSLVVGGNDRLSTDAGTTSTEEPNEYPHLGSVQVNLSWLNPNALRSNDTDNSYVVTAKGGVFYGSSAPSPQVMSELDAQRMNPAEYPLLDSRAHQLLIAYDNGWNAISSPEVFSRHTGTCLIIGDRSNQGRGHEIKLGDCFRLGSVGVVVSELKKPGQKEERLDTKRLQYLREEALHFDHEGDEAVLAAKEENGVMNRESTTLDGGGGEHEDEMVSPTARDNISGNLFCYMCYESHDTPEDHLVAPCACKGDTRYLHVLCLQKWYQSSLSGWRSLVIRTTGSGAPACKICGMAYKTTLTNLDGVKTNLLEAEHPGPYMSLVVVTRHDTSPELFNTKFRLNFGPGYRIGSTTEEVNDDPEMNPSELTIGRSSMCNMVLDYRTVSTVHAKLYFRDGQFQLQDARSSNGTMLYLQGPLKLPMNQQVRLRMGRSTLAIQARRSLSASLRTVFTKHKYPPCKASLDELQRIMALAPSLLSKTARMLEKEQLRNSLINSFHGNENAAGAGSGSASARGNAQMSGAGAGTGGGGAGTGTGVESGAPRRASPRGRSSPFIGGGRDRDTSGGSNMDDIPRVLAGAHLEGEGGEDSSAERMFVTEQMLRDIFRHHQSQLPQGVYREPDPNYTHDLGTNFLAPTSIPAPTSARGNGSGTGNGNATGSTLAVSDGGNIDSALILGERPRSSAGNTGPDGGGAATQQDGQGSGGGSGQDGGDRSLISDDPAAVTLPHTSAVFHPSSSAATSSPSHPLTSSSLTDSLLTRPPREVPTLNHHQSEAGQSQAGMSSVNNLASLTTATLASRDADGNPLINQAEFLLQLDHQLQTIESCVHEATASAVASVGDYSTPEDRQREHTEMRIQRAIISQSIQKDEATGKSIVDNESILLAATVISTKASAISARTTGKESRKADKVAKRYSVIADKANEMIIKKAIRQSAASTSCCPGGAGKRPVGGSGLMYEEDEDEGGYSHVYVDPEGEGDQEEEQSPRRLDQKGDEKEDRKEGDQKEKEDIDKGRSGAEQQIIQAAVEQLSRSMAATTTSGGAGGAGLENEELQLREAQALRVLETLSEDGVSSLQPGSEVGRAQQKDQEEVAMAVLLQAAQSAAVASGGSSVTVTGEDVDEVMKAIREVCDRRREKVASASSSSGRNDQTNGQGDNVESQKEQSQSARDENISDLKLSENDNSGLENGNSNGVSCQGRDEHDDSGGDNGAGAGGSLDKTLTE